MGNIRHLKQVEKLLKEQPNKAFSKTEIRDILGIYYPAVLDSLSYLLENNKIIKVKNIGEVEKYQWGKSNG